MMAKPTLGSLLDQMQQLRDERRDLEAEREDPVARKLGSARPGIASDAQKHFPPEVGDDSETAKEVSPRLTDIEQLDAIRDARDRKILVLVVDPGAS